MGELRSSVMKAAFRLLGFVTTAGALTTWGQTAATPSTSDLGTDQRTSPSTSVVQKVYTSPELETGNGPSFVTGETQGTGTKYGSSQQTSEPSSRATGTGAFHADEKQSDSR
jgi:hypothetical protein